MQERQRVVHDALNHAPCIHCHGNMLPKPHETLAAFVDRLTCSEPCRRGYIAGRTKEARLTAEMNHAPCAICKDPIVLGPKEWLVAFETRKTCDDPVCKAEHKRRLFAGTTLATPRQEQWWREKQPFVAESSFGDTETNDGGRLTEPRPDTKSYTGSSLS